MPEECEAIFVSICEHFAHRTWSLEQEKTFPMGRKTMKQLGYLARAVDAGQGRDMSR
jgi:hypothetical protein